MDKNTIIEILCSVSTFIGALHVALHAIIAYLKQKKGEKIKRRNDNETLSQAS